MNNYILKPRAARNGMIYHYDFSSSFYSSTDGLSFYMVLSDPYQSCLVACNFKVFFCFFFRKFIWL